MRSSYCRGFSSIQRRHGSGRRCSLIGQESEECQNSHCVALFLAQLVPPSAISGLFCPWWSSPAFPPLCDPYYGVTYFFPMCGASLVCEISPGRRPLQRHKVSTRKRNRRPQSKFAEMMAPTTGILCGRQCSKVALVVYTRDPLYSSANNNQGLKGCHVQRRKTAPLPKKGNLFCESPPSCILILV